MEGRRKGGARVRQGVESRVGHGGPRVERGEARFGACGAHCSTRGGAEGVGRGRMVVHVGDKGWPRYGMVRLGGWLIAGPGLCMGGAKGKLGSGWAHAAGGWGGLVRAWGGAQGGAWGAQHEA